MDAFVRRSTFFVKKLRGTSRSFVHYSGGKNQKTYGLLFQKHNVRVRVWVRVRIRFRVRNTIRVME